MPVVTPGPGGFNYITDQFTDPVTGVTVYDDGSEFYTSPVNGLTYAKNRQINGFYSTLQGSVFYSYDITLTQTEQVFATAYVTEDESAYYATEDGSSIYVPE